MSAVIRYLVRMAPFMLIALPVVLAVRIFLCRSRKKAGIPVCAAHEVWILMFAVYLVGLASLTVLPIVRWQEGEISFQLYGRGNLNLIPFRIFSDSLRMVSQGDTTYFLINFWGNIATFLPIGFFPMLLFSRITVKKAVFIGFCSSLFIEVCQIAIQRDSDIDDLLLNTLGALLGALLYRLLSLKWKEAFDRCNNIRCNSADRSEVKINGSKRNT